jgi:protein-S-isoprenylcysteine O-methyltransferase Ste14
VSSTTPVNNGETTSPVKPFVGWYRARGLAFAPPVIFTALWTGGESDLKWLSWSLGLGVFLVGVLIRIWAQPHLHYRLDIRKALTTTGPYAYVRNPIYIGNSLMLLGACVTSRLLWFVPIMLVWCIVVYRFVVRYEETHLLVKYGQPYADFLAKVPRWIPRWVGGNAMFGVKAKGLIGRSIVAELHTLTLLIPYVLKAIFIGG